MKDLDSSVG